MEEGGKKETELLMKALLGELSARELTDFENWLAENEEHQHLWTKMRQGGYLENELAALNEVDALTGYEQFLKRRKRWRLQRFVKYAAVLLPLGLLLAWSVRQTFNMEKQITAIPEKQIAQVVPGQVKAQLFLNDGSKYDLGEQDCRLNEGNVSVVVAGGKLQYENTVLEKEDVVKYNMLVIPVGGEYTLTLSDGTVVYLNAGSSLKYPVRFNGNTRRVEVSGEAYFEVAPDSLCPFVVSAASVEVRVLGTGFDVMAYPEEEKVQVTLVHGKVGVEVNSGETILRPSQQLEYNRINNRLEIKEVDVRNFVAWKEGMLIFDAMPLEELARKLSRWYNVDFSFSSEKFKQLRFSGTFRKYDDIHRVLELINTAIDVQFKLQGRTITVSPE